jgi:Domain of unknown function (DUF4331)
MKNLLGLCAISILGAGLLATACSGDDSSGTSPSGGAGGSAGKAGSGATAGKGGATGGTTGTAGKGGTTGTAGKGGTTAAGTGGASGAPGGAGEAGMSGGEAGAGGAGPTTPAPPTLGAQIDRMGRPGVNTALTDPFDIVTGKTEDSVKDAYNAESDPTKWATEFQAYINTSLAILDSLDSTATVEGCGNQLLYSATATGKAKYDPLASVLVDDRLYLNTKVPAGGTLNCTQYLGVEANAKGVTNSDCGGRALTYDVIDTTYSVLAIGALTGVSDGIASDSTFSTTFPFLAPPQ